MIDRIIKVNLGSEGVPPLVKITQGDTQWRFNFWVYWNNQRYTIPTGTTAILSGRKPDGHAVELTGSLSGNVVYVSCTEQFTAIDGLVPCTLQLFDTSGNLVNSCPVFFACAPDAKGGAEVSASDLSAYEELLAAVQQLLADFNAAGAIPGYVASWLAEHITNPSNPPVDTSLTVTGAAADAKVTGNAVGDLKTAFHSLAENKTAPVCAFQEISGIQRESRDVSIPAGTYRVTVDNVTSEDTDSDHSTIYFYYEESGSAAVTANWGAKTDKTVVFTNRVVLIRFFASNNAAHSSGDAFTFSGFALSKPLTDTTLTLDGIPADAGAVGTAVEEINTAIEGINTETEEINTAIESIDDDVSSVMGLLPIVCHDFVSGKHLQRYNIGQVVYIADDSTGVRAVNASPLFISRKLFLRAPSGYEFFLVVITDKTNYTVTATSAGYVSYFLLDEGYVLIQIRRTDQTPLSDADMTAINSWINFRKKEFSIEDVKRACTTKKTFYDGTGTSHGNSHGLFSIAHLTDIHTDVSRYLNYRQFVDENADIISCAICTGDYVDGQKAEQWAAMNAVTGSVPVLQVVGNHDAGHQAGDTLIFDADLVEKFGIETPTGKMYYYVDYAGDMRVIVLNQFEGSTKGVYVYSEDEITWLLSVLDDSIVNSKHVIIACHIPDSLPVPNNKGFYQRYNRYSQALGMNSGIETVIDAFRRGIAVSTTLTNDIAVNHTFSAAGDFLCWLCGHYHGDFIGYSGTHPDQLYLLGNIGASYPYPFKDSRMGETNSDLARIDGTPTEDCFNFYAFDLYSRTVKIARIGANVTDMMTERTMAVFPLDGEEST